MIVHGIQDLTKQWGVRVFTDIIVVHYFDTEAEAMELIAESADAELASKPIL